MTVQETAGTPHTPGWLRWGASRKGLLAGLAALLLGLLVMAVLLSRTGEEPGTGAREASADRAAPVAVASADLRNEDGRYGFAYPADWAVSTQGSRTQVASPRQDALVSVGVTSNGALRRTSRQFVQLVRRNYEKVVITGRQRDTVADAPALAVAGEATNPEGTRVRWMGIAVRRRGGNLLVAVYTDKAADPAAVLPHTQQIVSSLHLTR